MFRLCVCVQRTLLLGGAMRWILFQCQGENKNNRCPYCMPPLLYRGFHNHTVVNSSAALLHDVRGLLDTTSEQDVIDSSSFALLSEVVCCASTPQGPSVVGTLPVVDENPTPHFPSIPSRRRAQKSSPQHSKLTWKFDRQSPHTLPDTSLLSARRKCTHVPTVVLAISPLDDMNEPELRCCFRSDGALSIIMSHVTAADASRRRGEQHMRHVMRWRHRMSRSDVTSDNHHHRSVQQLVSRRQSVIIPSVRSASVVRTWSTVLIPFPSPDEVEVMGPSTGVPGHFWASQPHFVPTPSLFSALASDDETSSALIAAPRVSVASLPVCHRRGVDSSQSSMRLPLRHKYMHAVALVSPCNYVQRRTIVTCCPEALEVFTEAELCLLQPPMFVSPSLLSGVVWNDGNAVRHDELPAIERLISCGTAGSRHVTSSIVPIFQLVSPSVETGTSMDQLFRHMPLGSSPIVTSFFNPLAAFAESPSPLLSLFRIPSMAASMRKEEQCRVPDAHRVDSSPTPATMVRKKWQRHSHPSTRPCEDRSRRLEHRLTEQTSDLRADFSAELIEWIVGHWVASSDTLDFRRSISSECRRVYDRMFPAEHATPRDVDVQEVHRISEDEFRSCIKRAFGCTNHTSVSEVASSEEPVHRDHHIPSSIDALCRRPGTSVQHVNVVWVARLPSLNTLPWLAAHILPPAGSLSSREACRPVEVWCSRDELRSARREVHFQLVPVDVGMSQVDSYHPDVTLKAVMFTSSAWAFVTRAAQAQAEHDQVAAVALMHHFVQCLQRLSSMIVVVVPSVSHIDEFLSTWGPQAELNLPSTHHYAIHAPGTPLSEAVEADDGYLCERLLHALSLCNGVHCVNGMFGMLQCPNACMRSSAVPSDRSVDPIGERCASHLDAIAGAWWHHSTLPMLLECLGAVARCLQALPPQLEMSDGAVQETLVRTLDVIHWIRDNTESHQPTSTVVAFLRVTKSFRHIVAVATDLQLHSVHVNQWQSAIRMADSIEVQVCIFDIMASLALYAFTDGVVFARGVGKRIAAAAECDREGRGHLLHEAQIEHFTYPAHTVSAALRSVALSQVASHLKRCEEAQLAQLSANDMQWPVLEMHRRMWIEQVCTSIEIDIGVIVLSCELHDAALRACALSYALDKGGSSVPVYVAVATAHGMAWYDAGRPLSHSQPRSRRVAPRHVGVFWCRPEWEVEGALCNDAIRTAIEPWVVVNHNKQSMAPRISLLVERNNNSLKTSGIPFIGATCREALATWPEWSLIPIR
ncbi:MAG: hypothetical protein NEHIOOID_00858 [Holosporales bacterium]